MSVTGTLGPILACSRHVRLEGNVSRGPHFAHDRSLWGDRERRSEYAPPPLGPSSPPPGQEAVGGAIGGAVVGGILGGVLTGRPGGAAERDG
jgi:hypothetical protein